MLNVSIPRRYARALIAASTETKASVDKIWEQLDGLAQLFDQDPQLNEVAIHPGYNLGEKTAVMEAVLKAAGSIDPLVANLMRLLVNRHRLEYLPDIARLFRDQADALSGRVRGQLVTAVALPQELVAKLEQALKELTDREVVLQTRVDPSILGGASAQVGAIIYDGSLKSNLEAMRQLLKQS